ncbi:MAG: Bax inhibitor-1/YccA family protein, partial [Candidatus Marinimicrobia bacterium]|nr:Bax inhibitor-1/YccA family protein [Candidatus Neomarinimicrobiota bacterium]
MRSGNPALSAKTFKNAVSTSDEKMTIEGTVNKTAMSLLLLMATASYTWSNPSP